MMPSRSSQYIRIPYFFRILLALVVIQRARLVKCSSSSISYSGINSILSQQRVDTTATTTQEETEDTIKEILHKINEIKKETKKHRFLHRRPFLTVSYAQSINGIIATTTNTSNSSSSSSNLAISCPETKVLTHAIRSVHDGILIGSNTFFIDNPRLNVRLWNYTKQQQLRPIVLDTFLRSTMKFHQEKRNINANMQDVIICCSSDNNSTSIQNFIDTTTLTILPCNTIRNSMNNQLLDIRQLLHLLKQQYNIDSIMVEGGSQILSSFFQLTPDNDIIDCLLITISPQLIMAGTCGLNAFTTTTSNGDNNNNAIDSTKNVVQLLPIGLWKLGTDFVLLAKVK